MNKIIIGKLNWDKVDGLMPVVIQDQDTSQVLMLGYMNQEALQQTINTKLVTFFSRSKKRLWQKGETSGNTLQLVDIFPDCDNDTLLILAKPIGPTCHLGTNSCFGAESSNWLLQLETIIAERYHHPIENSYTSKLFAAGLNRIAQKVGEEAVETAIAAVSNDKDFPEEVADLIYHLLVLMRAKQTDFADILNILKGRSLLPTHN